MQDKREISKRLGLHTSIAGGVHLSLKRAMELGCSTMQIFSHNPRGWSRKSVNEADASEFRKLSEDFDIRPVFIHSSYLINLSSPDSDIRKKSVNLLVYELRMADMLGVDHVVLHPGKAVGQETREAMKKASESLTEVGEKAGTRAGLLLENTAGQKGDISSSIPLISDIIDGSRCDLVKGICLDTCHAFAAGYDITEESGLDSLRDEIRSYLSPLEVELIHLNDSRKGLSSGVDRHEHIGKGEIGRAGIKNFLSYSFFRDLPLVLETPKQSDGDDIRNLKMVKRILKEIGTET